MNPALVSNETVPAHPAHLISILPAIARLLLIGWEIDMRDICSGHCRFFILLFGLQMKKGAGARRLSLMKERSQISSEKLRVGRKWRAMCAEEFCGLTELGESNKVLVYWENEAFFLLYSKDTVCIRRWERIWKQNKYSLFQTTYDWTLIFFIKW